MKVISAQQMSYLESLAYSDGSSEVDFMEEAGSGISLVVHEYAEQHGSLRPIILVCGKGNNGGDAYVAGTNLINFDYEVQAYQIGPIGECSSLCRSSYQHFLQAGGRVTQINAADELVFPNSGLIVDGIFGTGFQGPVREPYGSIIAKMNLSNLPIIAVDIPSGLNGTNGQSGESAVIATETAFLSLPKTGFFLRDGWNCVGKLRYVDFGLPKNYIENSSADLLMLTSEIVAPYLPKIQRSRHKYQAGSVTVLAGSPGMPGAAILASSAALHAGAGIVHLLYPQGMASELAAAPYEIIKVPYDAENNSEMLALINKSSSFLVGPGIGRHPETLDLLKALLPKVEVPCVIDADALTLIAGLNLQLPKDTILTPHRGEMDRLLGDDKTPPLTLQYLHRCANFAAEMKVSLILKGGPSFIFHANEPVYVNPKGDPGMATAGSGDVLAGLIAALLAQKLAPEKAARLGVYIHGIAGEFAAAELTSYCMIASDILYRFPEGFQLQEI